MPEYPAQSSFRLRMRLLAPRKNLIAAAGRLVRRSNFVALPSPSSTTLFRPDFNISPVQR